MRLRTYGAFALVAGLFLASPGNAHAQDASGQVYSDVKGVLEELVTDEFADGATAWLACQTGHLPQYYVSSLQRLDQRQWGDLKSALRDDTIDLVSDYVYYVASRIRDHEDADVWDIRKFLTDPDPQVGLENGWKDWVIEVPEGGSTRADAVCKLLYEDLIHRDDRTARSAFEWIGADARVRLKNRWVQFLMSRSPDTIVTRTDSCDDSPAVSDPEDRQKHIACALARSLKATLHGKDGQAQVELLDVVTQAFFANASPPPDPVTVERFLGALAAWLKQEKNAQSIDAVFAPIADDLQGLGVKDLAACPPPTSLPNVLLSIATESGFKQRSDVLCAATADPRPDIDGQTLSIGTGYAARLGAVIGALYKGPNATAPTEPAVALAVACHASAPGQGPFPGCSAPAQTKTTLTFGPWSWDVVLAGEKTTVKASRPGVPDLASLVASARRVEGQQHRLDSAFAFFSPGGGGEPAKPRQLASTVIGLESLLHDLGQLRLFSEGGKLEYGSMLDAILRVMNTAPSLCSSASAAAKAAARAGGAEPGARAANPVICDRISNLADYVTLHRMQIHDVLTTASKRDYRALASDVLDIAIPAGKADSEDRHACSVDKPPYRRLALSLVSYLLDSNDKGGNVAISGEAFRSAAVEMIRCTSTSGLDRSLPVPSSRADQFWSIALHTLFRDAAIRASWNPAYRNAAGGNGYRTLVSVTGFNLHGRLTRKESLVYAGVEGSLIDWLAPLNEMALRQVDGVGYSFPGNDFLEIVHPRLDLIVGLPTLSEHLALSIGGAVRLVAPFQGVPTDDITRAPPTAGQLTYLQIWSSDERVKTSYASFIEVNGALNYVF